MLLPPSHPPEILRLLAHPLRWQVVGALTASDARVQELVERLQQPYNLVSYHLKLLRKAGLATLRQSDADGRDLYYHLELDRLLEAYRTAGLALYPGWQGPGDASPVIRAPAVTRVLFLCTNNSARSQMAEGFLRQLGGEAYEVASAGSQPQPIHPEAIAVMQARGVDIQRQRPRHLDEVKDQAFDYAITVCDRVREQCLAYHFCAAKLHWSIPDPAAVAERHSQRQAFEAAADELEQRIRQFMAWNAAARAAR